MAFKGQKRLGKYEITAWNVNFFKVKLALEDLLKQTEAHSDILFIILNMKNKQTNNLWTKFGNSGHSV